MSSTSIEQLSVDSNRKNNNKICKTYEVCHALNHVKEKGEIYYSNNQNGNYLAKIKVVNIGDNYYKLLRKGKKNKTSLDDKESLPIKNFWHQRYYYFSKYDEGIKLDLESWWSVTPENIAKYIAELIKDKTVIDGFCGSGGNVIKVLIFLFKFSKYCSKVYAVDIDSKKINLCINNCKVYNCKPNIEYIHSDFLELEDRIKVN